MSAWLRLQERFDAWRHGASSSASQVPVRDWISVGSGQPAKWVGYDQMLLFAVLFLMGVGLVMVYSASIALPASPKFARYTETHFFVRQVIGVGMALAAGYAAFQIPMKKWEGWAPWVFVASLVLLMAVLLPFIGKGVNGARRWIPLGITNFQPSELAKLGIALYASNYMVRKMDIKERFWKAVAPMGVAVGVIGMLLLAEPDMGAFMVIATIAMGVLFLGGVNGRMFFVITAVLIASFVLMITFSEFRRERIFAYLNPWDDKYAQGKAYQLTHSLIAFGRGEIFGQGLGNSVEKLHYLPEAHTDFILAVIGEELGLAGVCALIFIYFWVVQRCFSIGRRAIQLDRVFSGLFAQGIGLWIGGQGFINMGVNLGVLPTKGLTLPLVSYGGSALMIGGIAMAMVLRVDWENRQLMKGVTP